MGVDASKVNTLDPNRIKIKNEINKIWIEKRSTVALQLIANAKIEKKKPKNLKAPGRVKNATTPMIPPTHWTE